MNQGQTQRELYLRFWDYGISYRLPYSWRNVIFKRVRDDGAEWTDVAQPEYDTAPAYIIVKWFVENEDCGYEAFRYSPTSGWKRVAIKPCSRYDELMNILRQRLLMP